MPFLLLRLDYGNRQEVRGGRWQWITYCLQQIIDPETLGVRGYWGLAVVQLQQTPHPARRQASVLDPHGPCFLPISVLGPTLPALWFCPCTCKMLHASRQLLHSSIRPAPCSLAVPQAHLGAACAGPRPHLRPLQAAQQQHHCQEPDISQQQHVEPQPCSRRHVLGLSAGAALSAAGLCPLPASADVGAKTQEIQQAYDR